MPCNGSSCKTWLTGTNFFVYFSHFLSAWGDRMWGFGVGLFLINISPESLQLTAFYGLSMGLSVLLFGALVGDIVDQTPRLRAAQTALILQNAFVVACAIVIYIFLLYRGEIVSIGQWTIFVAYALIIILSVLSRLTSMARQIAVEKDWIVEMCGKDYDMLATMTASLRRIDLATQVLAPIATGLIMSFAGVEFGALFIGGWNLGSVVVEYYFLWKVYNTVPALKKKKDLKKTRIPEAENKETEEALVNDKNGNVEMTPMAEDNNAPDQHGQGEHQSAENKEEAESKSDDLDKVEKIDKNDVDVNEDTSKVQKVPDAEVKPRGRSCRCPRVFSSFERLFRGWPVYAHYDVVHAGLALACLYMTVLGFDSVTVGYAKMQGVSEGLVGVMMGVAACFGIFGTFMYPVMRRRLGLPRTGIFGLSLEIMSLTFCVISVWMPGSPFDLSQGFRPDSTSTANVTCIQDVSDQSNISHTVTSNVNETGICATPANMPESYLSIWMLLAGIVTARFGLWVADLSITQLFMEQVIESERGKVNGVQNSLNQLMDMLKFLMVVLAPYQHQFGLLVLISFGFICIGWLFYAYFLRKNRGHFFHFEKCVSGCGSRAVNGNV